jgi:hypothetical protein
MAILVHESAFMPKVPVDHAQRGAKHEIIEGRFLEDFASGRHIGLLPLVDMPFGEPPMAMAIEDQQKPGPFRGAPHHDASGRRFPMRSPAGRSARTAFHPLSSPIVHATIT